MSSSQPISLPTANHHHTYSPDYHMASSSYTGSPTSPFNPASYTRHFLGSPISWRPGSLGFGGRVFPSGSPMDHMLTVEYNTQSGSYESDRGSIINALNVVDREDELCRNYQCCGLQLTDLHALIEHFEEVHILRVDNPAAPGGHNDHITVPFNPQPIPATTPHHHHQPAATASAHQHSHAPPSQHQQQQSMHNAQQQAPYPVPFDPDEMELEMDVSSSHPQAISHQSSPSSGAPTPPDTPVSTPLSVFASSPVQTSPKTEFIAHPPHLTQLQVPTSPYSGSPHSSPLSTSQPSSPYTTMTADTLEALSLVHRSSHSEGSSPSRPNLNLNLTSFSRPPSSASHHHHSHHQTSTPEPFNPYARYAADYSAGMPGAQTNIGEPENGPGIAVGVVDGYSPPPTTIKTECVPPSLVFSNAPATSPDSGSSPASVDIPLSSPTQLSPIQTSRPLRPIVTISTDSSLSAAVTPINPSPVAATTSGTVTPSLSMSTPSSPISKSSSNSSASSLTRAHTASMLLSKPFKCPKPNCNKSYKQANGLKYHITHGSCNFAPPKDLEHVQAILEKKRRDRAQAEGISPHDDAAVDLISSISESDLREVEREAELRLRPFACGVGECQRRYKNMNGLRYHYQHSGEHGVIGLTMLANGTHECLAGVQGAGVKEESCITSIGFGNKKSRPNSKPGSRTVSRTGTPTPSSASISLSSPATQFPPSPISNTTTSSSSLAAAATAQVQAQAQLAYQQRFVDNQRQRERAQAQLAQQQQQQQLQLQQLQQQIAQHQQQGVSQASQQQQLAQMQIQLAAMHSRLYPAGSTTTATNKEV